MIVFGLPLRKGLRTKERKKTLSELRFWAAHGAKGSPLALFWGNAISRCKWAFEEDIF